MTSNITCANLHLSPSRRQELSPLPSQEVRDLLFSPGDKSVLPMLPYRHRMGISPVKTKSPLPASAPSGSAPLHPVSPPAGISQSNGLPSPVSYNKYRIAQEPAAGTDEELPSELDKPLQVPTAPSPHPPIPVAPQFATQQRASVDVYASSAAGGWKSYMEDRVLVPVSYAQDGPFMHKGWNIYAVCDGHGGAYCSQYLVDHFPRIIASIADRQNLLGLHCPDATPDQVCEILVEAFAAAEQELALNPRMEVEVKSVQGETHDPVTGQVCPLCDASAILCGATSRT